MYRIIKHKYITVIHEELRVIDEMVAKYYDIPKYENTLFILNYCFSKDDLRKLRNMCSRIIYYNLEHLSVESYFPQSNTWRDYFVKSLDSYDEIWDFLVENKKYYPNSIKSKWTFMPLRYVDLSGETPEKLYDLFFVGVIDTPVRKEMAARMSYVYKEKKASNIIVNGLYAEECRKLMRMAKFSLDFPHYRLFGNTQNAVRIHESICNNVQVISYTDTDRVINYFPTLINIINPVNGFDQDRTLEIVNNYSTSVNISKIYSGLTSTEKEYEAYRKRFLDYM